ncbi:uncharacterized protein LOC112511744 [Cynara cardunculus var. scolymus]|uniref:uncharacterized protein LOC112511744 n=1 Tax=Cynara cardunculus var. scolymus TaxID=59895 RepID=UPI000D62E55B|nr:uncharacterized protein LOC112511744 [Cynara cardunculus var. scolymus]
MKALSADISSKICQLRCNKNAYKLCVVLMSCYYEQDNLTLQIYHIPGNLKQMCCMSSSSMARENQLAQTSMLSGLCAPSKKNTRSTKLSVSNGIDGFSLHHRIPIAATRTICVQEKNSKNSNPAATATSPQPDYRTCNYYSSVSFGT